MTKPKKYATIPLGLVLVLASIAAAQAAELIPAQYHGSWCPIKTNAPDSKRTIYERCRDIGDQQLGINSRGIAVIDEVGCRPLAIKSVRDGHKLRCRCGSFNQIGTVGPKEYWIVTERWRLLANGRRLEVETK
jgi:hypothetical protein